MRDFAWLVLGMFCVAGAACAQGSGADTQGFSQLDGVGGGGGAGASGSSSSSSSSGHTTSSSGNTSSSSSSGNTSSSSSSGSSGQGGAGGAGGGGGSGGGGGQSCSYASPNGCAAAPTVLPAIDGDQNSDTRTASGTTSKWFQVKVNEGVSSLISYPALSYTVTLTSPPGEVFDLFVYTGDVNGPSCFSSPKKGAGSPEKVSAKWGDNIGTDDTTVISIEVRYVSGMDCSPQPSWNLKVQGHTM